MQAILGWTVVVLGIAIVALGIGALIYEWRHNPYFWE